MRFVCILFSFSIISKWAYLGPLYPSLSSLHFREYFVSAPCFVAQWTLACSALLNDGLRLG